LAQGILPQVSSVFSWPFRPFFFGFIHQQAL